MNKVLLLGCMLLLVFCVSKKATVQTEGLEEVLVFGEEESNISTEPVLPEPTATVVPPPATEEIVLPSVSEEVIMPPISEEFTLPPIIEPPVVEEVVAPPVLEEVLPPITEIAVAPPVAEEPVMPAYTPTPTPTSAPPPPASIHGFRVQIFASSTEKNASRIANDAQDTFNTVYIEYLAPYYKVRVGNCLTRDEAEMLKSKALKMGYRGAFVVETKIAP